MTENIAISWIQELRARGVTLTLRNNRLWLHPASAYKNLTDEELITLRHHRQEIKDCIAFGVSPAPLPSEPAPLDPQPEKPQPVWAPQPEIPEHIARIINWNKPEERKRRDAEATAVMYRTVGKTSPYL
jgi:hypothetical protein